MKFNKISKLTLLSLITFISLSIVNKVQAQTEVNLTVSPPISYLHVPPGTTREHIVILENSGDTPITVNPSIVDFSSDGKSGKVVLSNELSFPYISFGLTDITELTIPAKRKAQLSLYIDVPAEATEREYPLTVLFFSKQTTQDIDSTHSQLQAGIGSNLVILVSKENILEKIISVLDFGTPTFVDSFSKLSLEPIIENNSFGSTLASGTVKIVDWKKNTLAEYEIYPDVILGNSSREIRALRPGISENKPETGSFSYKPNFLIGPYQVVINLNNEQGNTATSEVQVFYALPISISIILIIGVIISVVYSKKIKSNN